MATNKFVSNNNLFGDSIAINRAPLGGLTTIVAAPPPPPIIVRDNTKFATSFDTVKVITAFKPTRTLVVSQSPRPGELVPVGTPVDLTVTIKEQLPIEGIKNLHPSVADRFRSKNVGDLLGTLTQSDAKRVFDTPNATDYDKLPSTDKALVNDYLRGAFGINAAEDQAGARSAYDNVKFMVDF